MKIAITGAAGQLGRALREELAQHQLVCWTRADLDIGDLDRVRQILAVEKPDILINTAGYTDVDGAEAAIADTYRVNALGARNVAIATADIGCPILHISTDFVFDGRGTRPYHEFDATGPRSVYGASKLAGEIEIRTFNPRHYIVRTAWLYHTVSKNFPKTMISLAEKNEMRVVSDQYGSPTFCPHLAAATHRLLDTNAWGIYHLAGDGAASWFELTQRVFRELEITTPVYPVATTDFPRPAERPRYSVLTTAQNPEIRLPPWEDGVREFCSAVRAGHLID